MIDSSTIIDRLNQRCSTPGPEDVFEELEEEWQAFLESLSYSDLFCLLRICSDEEFPKFDESGPVVWWKESLLECLSAAGRKDEKTYLKYVIANLNNISLRKWLISTVPMVSPLDCLKWLKVHFSLLSDEEGRDFINRTISFFSRLSLEDIEDVRRLFLKHNKTLSLASMDYSIEFRNQQRFIE